MDLYYESGDRYGNLYTKCFQQNKDKGQGTRIRPTGRYSSTTRRCDGTQENKDESEKGIR